MLSTFASSGLGDYLSRTNTGLNGRLVGKAVVRCDGVDNVMQWASSLDKLLAGAGQVTHDSHCCFPHRKRPLTNVILCDRTLNSITRYAKTQHLQCICICNRHEYFKKRPLCRSTMMKFCLVFAVHQGDIMLTGLCRTGSTIAKDSGYELDNASQ